MPITAEGADLEIVRKVRGSSGQTGSQEEGHAKLMRIDWFLDLSSIKRTLHIARDQDDSASSFT